MKLKKRISAIVLAVALMVTAFIMPTKQVQAEPIRGNFVWIWQLQNEVNKYGSIDGLINHLKSIGITNVCIKYHEGASYTGGGVNFRYAYLQYKQAFKNAGFQVGTWGYNYFNYPQAEADIISEAIRNSDYYIYDPEIDVANKFSQTEYVTSTVRSNNPQAEIGYSSFPIATYHQDINYKAFDTYCNFTSPQIYWGELQWGANKAIDRTLSDYRALGLNKPIYPSIQTYGVGIDSYNAYKAYGFAITGAWSLDEANNTFNSFIGGLTGGHYIPVNDNINNNNKNVVVKNNANMFLQYNLTHLLNYNVAQDGIYGNQTTLAVKQFQSMVNIQRDGIAGNITNNTIDKIMTKPILKYGSSGTAVKYLQYRLGISNDGDFKGETQRAVINYERQHGLTVDSGIVGQEVWNSLLGL